jgi:hypothetical protein
MAEFHDAEKQASGKSEEREDATSSQLNPVDPAEADNYTHLTVKVVLVYLVIKIFCVLCSD